MAKEKDEASEWMTAYETRLRRQGIPAHVAEETARRAFEQERRRGVRSHGSKARPQDG